jgi:hypothetical protein
MKECCSVVKTLSDDSVREIENLIESKMVHLIAIDINGKPTPLTNKDVQSELLDYFSFDNPIKTQAITSIESIAIGTFEGSCHAYYKWGNQLIKYTYHC